MPSLVQLVRNWQFRFSVNGIVQWPYKILELHRQVASQQ